MVRNRLGRGKPRGGGLVGDICDRPTTFMTKDTRTQIYSLSTYSVQYKVHSGESGMRQSESHGQEGGGKEKQSIILNTITSP